MSESKPHEDVALVLDEIILDLTSCAKVEPLWQINRGIDFAISRINEHLDRLSLADDSPTQSSRGEQVGINERERLQRIAEEYRDRALHLEHLEAVALRYRDLWLICHENNPRSPEDGELANLGHLRGLLFASAGRDYAAPQQQVEPVAELESDAAMWRAFRESVKAYTREDLVNARNGQIIQGLKHWTIWCELPDKSTLDSAIEKLIDDAAKEGE